MDISLSSMFWGFLIVSIPIFFLNYYKTGLAKDAFISIIRMSVQLFFVGFYLKYMFKLNLWWVNALWVLIMTIIASDTIIRRTKSSYKELFIAISSSLLFTIILIDIYFMYMILELENIFDARYFIPISGMIMGNMLSANVIAINSYKNNFNRDRQLYIYRLANGATYKEAHAPFIKGALIQSFNPTIASMAIMGLISLPGTMTGQILGGSSPDIAIKYQIMLMSSIFVASFLSVLITLLLISKKIECYKL